MVNRGYIKNLPVDPKAFRVSWHRRPSVGWLVKLNCFIEDIVFCL